jgi:hypothetical protein
VSTNTFDYSVGEPSDAEVTADSARRGKARRAAERGGALRREHPGREHRNAADAHREALRTVRGTRQQRYATRDDTLREYFSRAAHARPPNDKSMLSRFIKDRSNERVTQ